MTYNHSTLSLAPYLDLARELAALLVPQRLRPEFKRALEAGLLTEARRQHALRQLAISSPAAAEPHQSLEAWRDALLEGPKRHWVIGAATLGSAVSIVGLLAYLWRQRNQRAA
ncbi:MAG: hypothetical protein ACUVR4_13400 [Anaerolineae bacterium]